MRIVGANTLTGTFCRPRPMDKLKYI